jgi:hypothetical protein
MECIRPHAIYTCWEISRLALTLSLTLENECFTRHFCSSLHMRSLVQNIFPTELLQITLTTSNNKNSSVGIATRYGLEGPGIESRWVDIFRTSPDWLRGPPSLLYNTYRVFPGDKGGRGVMLTTHPLLVPRLRKS